MNSPANNISITTLPPRLLYRILDELYLSDLLRCTEVCTVLNRIVHGIPSLQYKVELAKQALEDIPSNTLPASRKLALIRQYEAAWTKHFSSSLSKATFPMIDPMRWTLRGGVLARLVEDFKLDLFKPARVIRGTPQMHWALELSDRPYQFDIDVDQSLLIMVLQIEDDSSRHYLSLRDLNTGMKPRSARSSILPIPDHLTNPCYDIATFGNKLAVMPRWNLHDDPKFNVVIWDWQLGLPVLAIDDLLPELQGKNFWTDLTSVAFLDEDHVVFSARTIYDDGRRANPRLLIVDLNLGGRGLSEAVVLNLPPPASSYQVELVALSRQAPTVHACKQSGQVPFQTSQHQATIAIDYGLRDVKPAGEWVNNIIFVSTVRLRMLYNTHSVLESKSIPWEEWGPVNTRGFVDMHLSDLAVFGTRTGYMSDSFLMLYDFNEDGARADTKLPTDEHDLATTSVGRRYLEPAITDTKCFEPSTLITCMPYRIHATGILQDEGYDIYLSEDTILVINGIDNEFYLYSI